MLTAEKNPINYSLKMSRTVMWMAKTEYLLVLTKSPQI